MILRRIIEGFKRQDGVAIAIEFMIVVVGVGLGTIVADWNADRLDQREAERMLVRFADYLEEGFEEDDLVLEYYRVKRVWAKRTLQGLEDPLSTNDRDFVVAAFQATQTIGNDRDSSFISNMVGADFARSIDDDRLRTAVMTAMGDSDNSYFNPEDVESDYRQDIRSVVPPTLQERLHYECGDRAYRSSYRLPETCDIVIDEALAAQLAREIRDIPDIERKLAWHLAKVEPYLQNITNRRLRDEDLVKMIRTGDYSLVDTARDEEILIRRKPDME